MNPLLRHVIFPLVIFGIAVALVLEAAKRYPAYVFGTLALLLVTGLVRGHRQRKLERARGWRVGHAGRDAMYYEEFREDGWQRMEIDGEMLVGTKANRVIYFDNLQIPEWATGRRDEIISRIKSEFHPPKYVYDEAGQ
jgi:hypothetical protein